MRFEAVDDTTGADYILDIQIEDYGIGSDGWDAPLFYEIMARLSLIEVESGTVLWKEQVLDMAPVARALFDVLSGAVPKPVVEKGGFLPPPAALTAGGGVD